MVLSTATDQDLKEVLSWFSSARELLYWGGPDLTFPPALERFKIESKFNKSHSFVLCKDDQLLAFGQLYNRLDRIHLGRLVVAPKQRGQRIGAQLIKHLIEQGRQLLGVQDASLFVLNDNQPAMRLYQRLGFIETPYPKPIPLDRCIYMIKPAQTE